VQNIVALEEREVGFRAAIAMAILFAYERVAG
jgi:hypothetical protein